MLVIFALLAISQAALAQLSWFSASDTHLGHDPASPNGSITTSYEKNVWAITEMNLLPGNDTWPQSLGGGPVLAPAGLTISGDLIDDGYGTGNEVNSCKQWSNFTSLFGLDGTDGMLRYKAYEGRGNHDGGNTTNSLPAECLTQPSSGVAARNIRRAASPAFSIDSVSTPTGLHYSWTWNITDSCRVHFVHLNLFPGHACGSSSQPNREGPNTTGFQCGAGWTWPEDSLGFLEADLPAHADELIVTIQHYGYDGWSLTWFNSDQAMELVSTLNKYKPLAILVGHTHSAELYSFNGTHQGDFTAPGPGFIPVINAPATQKEDGVHNPQPSEFMVLEANMDGDGNSGKGTLRVAQRVGHGWGTVLGATPFQC